MLIKPANLCGALLCLLGCLQFAGCSQLASAQCKQPKDEDRPHGGKEFVLAGEGPVAGIYGTIVARDEKVNNWLPVGDVVVELYSYSGGANQEDVSKAVREQKRVVACLTGDDGRFSFSGLEPGRYLFRAGTRAPDKYDEIYAILILDPKTPQSQLKILLPVGK